MKATYLQETDSVSSNADTLAEHRKKWDASRTAQFIDVVQVSVDAQDDVTGETGSAIQAHLLYVPRGEFETVAAKVRALCESLAPDAGDASAFPIPTARQNMLAELVYYMMDKSDDDLRDDVKQAREDREPSELWYGNPRIQIIKTNLEGRQSIADSGDPADGFTLSRDEVEVIEAMRRSGERADMLKLVCENSIRDAKQEEEFELKCRMTEAKRDARRAGMFTELLEYLDHESDERIAAMVESFRRSRSGDSNPEAVEADRDPEFTYKQTRTLLDSDDAIDTQRKIWDASGDAPGRDIFRVSVSLRSNAAGKRLTEVATYDIDAERGGLDHVDALIRTVLHFRGPGRNTDWAESIRAMTRKSLGIYGVKMDTTFEDHEERIALFREKVNQKLTPGVETAVLSLGFPWNEDEKTERAYPGGPLHECRITGAVGTLDRVREIMDRIIGEVAAVSVDKLERAVTAATDDEPAPTSRPAKAQVATADDDDDDDDDDYGNPEMVAVSVDLFGLVPDRGECDDSATTYRDELRQFLIPSERWDELTKALSATCQRFAENPEASSAEARLVEMFRRRQAELASDVIEQDIDEIAQDWFKDRNAFKVEEVMVTA